MPRRIIHININCNNVRFEVFVALNIQVIAFWVVVQQDITSLYSVTTQKTMTNNNKFQ